MIPDHVMILDHMMIPDRVGAARLAGSTTGQDTRY